MTKEELLKMKLHDSEKIDGNLFVRRVFGGWLYIHYSTTTTSCFVPEVLNVEAKDATDRTHEY